jgi:hypothetical protein
LICVRFGLGFDDLSIATFWRLLGTMPMMDDQVVFERKKWGLTADRKKIEKGKKNNFYMFIPPP